MKFIYTIFFLAWEASLRLKGWYRRFRRDRNKEANAAASTTSR